MAEQRQAADRLSVHRDRLALSSDLDRLADRAAEHGLDERARELRTVAAHLRSKEVQLRSQEAAPAALPVEPPPRRTVLGHLGRLGRLLRRSRG